jgi:hypothetical protein
MRGAILVGVSEQHLHSMHDYLHALDMILSYNDEVGHLYGNVAPLVADWPGQLFVRKAITHLQHANANDMRSPIRQEVASFVPILGPLHVSLNT